MSYDNPCPSDKRPGSSVVEHFVGNEEVDSSILFLGSINFPTFTFISANLNKVQQI